MANAISSGTTFQQTPVFSQSIATDRILEDKISGMTAWHIELISLTIAKQILSNLGPPKWSLHDLTALILKDTFLSKEKAELLTHSMLLPIREAVTQAFSTPIGFLDVGLSFQISDVAPSKILEESAQNVGIEITMDNVPSKYSIALRIEKEQSRKNSILIFSLIEKSGDVEFSKHFYTFDEMDKKFKSKY